MRQRRQRRGFTLLEIMVVILILGLLVVFVAPNIMSRFGRAKKDIAQTAIYFIEERVKQFELDCSRPVSSEKGLIELVEAPDDIEEGLWCGPYLKQSQLVDPWGNPYEYIAEGEVNEGGFDIVSYGKDGKPGGEGDAADIFNE